MTHIITKQHIFLKKLDEGFLNDIGNSFKNAIKQDLKDYGNKIVSGEFAKERSFENDYEKTIKGLIVSQNIEVRAKLGIDENDKTKTAPVMISYNGATHPSLGVDFMKIVNVMLNDYDLFYLKNTLNVNVFQENLLKHLQEASNYLEFVVNKSNNAKEDFDQLLISNGFGHYLKNPTIEKQRKARIDSYGKYKDSTIFYFNKYFKDYFETELNNRFSDISGLVISNKEDLSKVLKAGVERGFTKNILPINDTLNIQKDWSLIQEIVDADNKEVRTKLKIDQNDKHAFILTTYNGIKVSYIGADLMRAVDEILADYKSFYFDTEITEDEFKRKLLINLSEIAEIFKYVNLKLANPNDDFDQLLIKNKFGKYLKNIKIKELRDAYVELYKEYNRSVSIEIKTYLKEYFKTELNSKFKEQIITFIIPDIETLQNLLKVGIEKGFTMNIFGNTLGLKFDQNALIKHRFMLDYTSHSANQSINYCVNNYLNDVIQYKSDLTSQNLDVLTNAQLKDFADEIIQAVLNVNSIQRFVSNKSAKNTPIDIKKLIFLNALILLSTNYGYSNFNKRYYYTIENWDSNPLRDDYSNLTSFFDQILNEHETSFNSFFITKDMPTITVESIVKKDIYNEFRTNSKKIFKNLFNHLSLNPTQDDLSNTFLNIPQVDIIKQEKEAKEKENISNKLIIKKQIFNPYDENSFDISNDSTIITFIRYNMGTLPGQYKTYVDSVFSKVLERMNIDTSPSRLDLIENFIIDLRDWYFKKHLPQIPFEKAIINDAEIDVLTLRYDDIKANRTMYNIVNILFLSSHTLKTDISTIDKARKVINQFKDDYSSLDKADNMDFKQIKDYFEELAIKKNDITIGKVAIKMFKPDEVDKYVEIYKSAKPINYDDIYVSGKSFLIDSKDVETFFKNYKDKIEKEGKDIDKFEKLVSLNNITKNDKELFNYAILQFKEAIQDGLGKDLKLVIKTDLNTNDLYVIALKVLNRVLKDTDIKIPENEEQKNTLLYNMISMAGIVKITEYNNLLTIFFKIKQTTSKIFNQDVIMTPLSFSDIEKGLKTIKAIKL